MSRIRNSDDSGKWGNGFKKKEVPKSSANNNDRIERQDFRNEYDRDDSKTGNRSEKSSLDDEVE